MAKLFWTVCLVFVAALAYRLHHAGVFKTIEPHLESPFESCTPVYGVVGAEDIVVDRTRGVLYISAATRRPGDPQRGDIFSLDLTKVTRDRSTLNKKATLQVPAVRKLRLVMDSNEDETTLFPHGIDLFHDAENNKTLLFVVNHRKAGDHVEIFEINNDDNTLTLVSSNHDSELLTNLNDVSAAGRRSFYASNDHAAPKLLPYILLQDLLSLSLADIAYYDGEKKAGLKAATGISYANGVAVSKDGTHVYVAATTSHDLLIYSRNVTSGVLTLEETIPTGTGVDNIDIDDDGSLWIGCHPNQVQFLRHATDASKVSPSQVLKISKPPKSDKWVVEEVYLSEGRDLSASSVAIHYNDFLVIGPVFDDHILLCTEKN